MLKQILIRLVNLHTTLRFKLYPRINRMIFKAHGVEFGRNLQIPGGVMANTWGEDYDRRQFLSLLWKWCESFSKQSAG